MKTKNTFLFTFLHTMKKYFFLPLMIFASLMAGHAMNLTEAYHQFIMEMQKKALTSGVSFESLIKDARYIFTFVPPDGWSSSADQLLVFLMISIILSALLGIMLFKFVTNKKTVNVYYSLGIKRTDLFISRYLAGAVMILIAVSIPVLVTVFVNIAWFGSSAILWKAAFFHVFHYLVVCLASFTIAAAVSGCIGTMVESVGFTAILLVFPTVAKICFENICKSLLNGIPTRSILFTFLEDFEKDILISLDNTALGKFLLNVNLFQLNNDRFFKMGQVLEKNDLKSWAFPSISPYLLWIALIAVIFVLGVIMFKKRKAEICGFTGKNKFLNSVASALISFFVISIISVKIENVFVLTLLGILISFIFFSIIELILTRSLKDYVKALKIAPVHAVLVILLISTLATGFFGYSKRIPDIEEIESVRISMPITLTGAKKTNSFDRYEDFKFRQHKDDSDIYNYFYLQTAPNHLMPEMKDKNDIKAVLDIHKAIIDEGKLYKEDDRERTDYSKRTSDVYVAIVYKLKDGTEFTRYYERISNSNIEKLLKLEDSKAWNKYIDDSLKNRDTENTVPLLLSKQMEKKTFIDRNLNKSLLNALADDIKNLSYESFWKSDAQYIGTISIHNDPYFEGSDDIKIQAELDKQMEVIPADEMIRRMWIKDSKFEYFSFFFDSEAVVIPITSEMKNTVKFLKDNNLYDDLFDASPVVSAKYVKAVSATARTQPQDCLAPLFLEFWEKGDAEPFKNNDIASSEYVAGGFMPKSAKTTTDQNVIASLLNNAYGLYLDTQGESAYIVEFTRQNGEKTIMYVPSGRVNLE